MGPLLPTSFQFFGSILDLFFFPFWALNSWVPPLCWIPFPGIFPVIFGLDSLELLMGWFQGAFSKYTLARWKFPSFFTLVSENFSFKTPWGNQSLYITLLGKF